MQKKTHYFGYILIGLFLLGVGILFISFNSALKALVISIGVLLALFGVIFGIITISKKDRGFLFTFKMILAVLCLVCGIVTAIMHEGAAEYVISLFSLLLTVDAAFKLNTSAMSKRYKVKLWLLMLIPSVLLIIGGYAITKFPPESSTAASVLLGILIIIDGILNIFSSVYVPKFEKKMRLEVISEYEESKKKTEENN